MRKGNKNFRMWFNIHIILLTPLVLFSQENNFKERPLVKFSVLKNDSNVFEESALEKLTGPNVTRKFLVNSQKEIFLGFEPTNEMVTLLLKFCDNDSAETGCSTLVNKTFDILKCFNRTFDPLILSTKRKKNEWYINVKYKKVTELKSNIEIVFKSKKVTFVYDNENGKFVKLFER